MTITKIADADVTSSEQWPLTERRRVWAKTQKYTPHRDELCFDISSQKLKFRFLVHSLPLCRGLETLSQRLC